MKRERKDGTIVIKISIMWIFVLVIIVALIIAFFKNYIFATNEQDREETETEIVVAFEKNANAVDVLEVMVENNYSNRKIVNETRDIEYETERTEVDNLPKGEEKVEQEGEVGKVQVRALQEYQNGELISEEIIESIIEKEPVKEIIYVGTSEFLSKYSVHIGDEMYLIESGELKQEESEDSDTITKINRYLNVELLEVSDDWAKVKYNDKEGYIKNSKLTSEAVTPKITEKNRIAKLQETLDENMDLSKVSGLTLSDYKTIFAYNENDRNGIFAENAEAFYEAEQKYDINGIFLAAIGIHESAWGTSKIAETKCNLFGYKAYDRDPEGSAATFDTYADCIDTVASAISRNYLTTSGSYYNGTTIKAVNTRYASDQNWSNKVYSYMEYLYDKLG